MKINLHCHTNYSDGDYIDKMAEEHQKQGFSTKKRTRFIDNIRERKLNLAYW